MPMKSKVKKDRRRVNRRGYKRAAGATGSYALQDSDVQSLGVREPPSSRGRDDIAEIRAALGVTQEEFGRLTGSSTRTIAALENNETQPTSSLHRKITEVARLKEALLRVLPREAIPEWLETPNRAFDDLKPIEAIERGHADRV